MSYDLTKLTRLQALKDLAERLKSTDDIVANLQSTVDGIVSTGGEANKIDSISVNGTAQTIDSNKNVDITVPEKVSDLTNDSDFQTATEVETAIDTAISESGHAHFEVVSSVPDPSDAEENVLYLVMNSDTGYYDIYALISGEMVRLDDTTVDLSDYYTQEETDAAIAAALADIDLSEYYTKAETDAAIEAAKYEHPTHTAYDNGFYKITVDSLGHVTVATAVTSSDIADLGVAITDTTYDVATQSKDGLMSASDKTKLDGIEIATSEEVAEMLTDVFGE